ncbi:MAG: N-acetyltransferase, partial [Oscillospiraceae bacterium]|nr:N-acetyltransferase [Oscillospiraceae bacterium]
MKLNKIGVDDAEKLWKMQVKAFQGLYEKYQDTETSPATETIDKIIMRLNQPFTYYYFIEENGITVEAVRVVDSQEKGMAKR